MKTFAQRLPVIMLVLAIGVSLTACGGNGNSGSSIAVSLTQSGTTATMSAGSSPVTVTASVTNDKSNAGVNWSLSPSSGCGVLAPSGAGARYTPPLESSLNADCNATVTATSVTNGAKNATLAFTLKAIEINLPAGEQTSQLTTASGSSLTLSASIADDASGTATLNWSLTGSPSPAAAHLLKASVQRSRPLPEVVTSTCGSLSASTGTSVTYTPPSSLSCTAAVTVSTSANPNVRKAFTISVNPPLTISTSPSLAAGTFGASYTASLAATGGISPYTWALASGSLPPGLTLSAGGVLLGTPTAAGTYSFSIAAGDSYTPPDTVQQTFSLTIGKAALTVTANNASKTYGAVNPSFSPSYTGFVHGDTSAVLTGTPNLTTTATPSSSVNNYPITATQGTLTAANYSFLFQPGTLTIGAKALLVTGLSASNKVYDGTAVATLNVSGAVLSGVLNGDTVTLSGTAAGTFASTNVGTGLAVNITGLALAGASAGNYTLTQTATLAANITPKPLTVTGMSANSKVYDGTTAATLNGSGAGLSGVVASDNVTLNSAGYTASFASKNVANGVAVTVSNLVLGGSAAVNYTLTQPVSLTANITPKALTVTGLSASSKIYDGSNAASLTGSPALNGVLLGDTISLSGTAIGGFAAKGVGTGIAVNVTGLTLTGASAGNYTLTQPAALSANITPKGLTVAGLSVNSKVYDSTTAATLNVSGAVLTGVLNGDTVALSGTAAGAFASANAGTGIVVNVTGLSLIGASAVNYTLTPPTSLTANITPKTLTVTGLSANTKVYDDTTVAMLSGTATLSGVLSGDAVTLSGTAVGTFTGANVGTAIPVNVTGLSLSGVSAGNYTVTLPVLAANITLRSLTVTGLSANGKIYDGTNAATVNGTATLIGVPSGDTLTLSGTAVYTFASANAGTGIAVNVAGLSLTGTNAADYTLTMPAGLAANITPKALTVTGVSANNKVYDGTTAATLNLGGALLSGVVNGDTVTLNGTAVGTFASANAFPGIAVKITGLSLTGANGNYTLTPPTSLTANIFPKALTVTANNKTMAVGAPVPPLTVTYSGFVNNETAAVLNGTPLLSTTATSSSPVGSYPITVTQGVLNATNYTFSFQNGTLTISPAIYVTLSPNTQQNLYTGGTLQITPTLFNAGTNNGVNLTITPACGSLSATSGTSGTPVTYTAPAGSCVATVTATSVADGTKSATLNINVYAQLSLPPSGPFTPGPATAGQAYAGAVNASGGVPPITWSVTGLPADGLSATNTNGSTLTIGGTPTTATTGVTFTAQATDAAGTHLSKQYSIAVNPVTPLSIQTPITLPTAYVGQTYNGGINAQGGAPGYTWTATPLTGSLPAGLSLTNLSGSTLRFAGTTQTPTGTFNFTVQVTDSMGTKVSAPATITVLNPTPLSIQTPINLPTAFVGQSYNNAFINAQGGVPGYTWTATPTVGSLPGGLSLTNLNGTTLQITGTTTAAPGTYNFTVQVTDNANNKATAQASITVSNPTPLSIQTPINLPTAYVGQSYNGGINAQGGAGGYTWNPTPTVGNLPAGLSLSNLNGPTLQITGTTTAAPGSYPFTVQVTDSANNKVSAQASITVSVPIALSIQTPINLPTAYVGQSYNSGGINAQGGAGGYTWNATPTVGSLPAGLSLTNLNGSTLQITGTTTAAPGTYTFTVQVTDSANTKVSAQASITVSAPIALSIQTPDLPTAYVGQSYNNAWINAQGGAGGFTWNPTPTVGSLPAGLSLSNLTGNTLQIIGTTTAIPGTYTFTVQVTDSANTKVSVQASITVSNPLPLSFQTTQQDIGGGLVGTPYSTWINVQGGSGNYGSYVYSISSGSLPDGLSFSTTNTNEITGTPTTANSYTFTVQVTDSSVTPTQTAQATYTVVVSTGPNGTNNHYLYGRYAFLFRGYVDNPNFGGALYQSASVGSFFADGTGKINNVQFNINDGNSGGTRFAPANLGVTGTYSIGADNRAILTLTKCATSTACYEKGFTSEFVFAVGQIVNTNLSSGTCPTGGSANNASCPVYTDGRLIEFDDVGATPSGVHGEGELFMQSSGQFSNLSGPNSFATNVIGNWVFSLEGEDTTQNPLAVAGVFAAQTGTVTGSTLSGAINSGTTDINDNSAVSQLLSLGGSDTYTASSTAIGANAGWTTATGNFTGTITAANAPLAYPTNYVFYYVNKNRMVGMSWDPHTQNSLVSGILYKQQQASYTDSSMPGAAVMYMTGQGGADLLQLTCLSGTCTINASDGNSNGTYTHNQNPPAGTVLPVNVTTNGRGTFTGAGNKPPIFYLYDSSATGGAVVLNTGGAQFGRMLAQGTAPSTLSAAAGSYYMGDLFNWDSSNGGGSGSFTVDSLGAMNGNDDKGSQGQAKWGETMTGLTVSTPPWTRGIFNITAGGQTQVICYLVNPVCSGGSASCGGSGQTPYAMYACMGPTDNNAKVTLVQQVQ